MKRSTTLLSIVGAAAAGFVAGLLVAPRKGRETRENLTDFVKSHYPGVKNRRLSALADQIAKDFNDTGEDVKAIAREAKRQAKEKARDIKHEIKEHVKDLKQQVKESK